MSQLDLVLFDHREWGQLFPLTFTRPISELRIGITTIAQKWSSESGKKVYYHSADYLAQKYTKSVAAQAIMINGAVLPTVELLERIRSLSLQDVLKCGETIVAFKTKDYGSECTIEDMIESLNVIEIDQIEVVEWPEDILRLNDIWIERDVNKMHSRDDHVDLSNTIIIGPKEKIKIGSDARLYAYSMNTSDGPIHIGNNVIIMEGAMLRGPISVGDNSVIKMGAKLYGKTSIGPNCKVGGEIKRVVMYANSNKGHEGYLGDSVIGEWCNFGADSNNSNMKNTYGKVNLYNISAGQKRKTSEHFMGLIMGDHCRCAINTQFNTGTVASYFANIFGTPPSTYIKPFQWGEEGQSELAKALDIARIVHERRQYEFLDEDEAIIRFLYNRYCK